MSFSSATLDDFNRANALTLGANWTTADGAAGLEIFNNTAGANNINGDQFALWDTSFAATQRVWAVLRFPAIGQMAPPEVVWLAFRCPTAAALDGYAIVLRKDLGALVAALQRLGVGELDSHDTGLGDLLDGDFIGVDVADATFTLYHGLDAASAVPVAVFSDAGITDGGYIGIGYRVSLA